jgi:hypothetical protein
MKCGPGCACGRHVSASKGRKCAPGCACGHHSRPDLGDASSYAMLHRRVRAAQGKASGHSCVRCGGHAREWAQVHTEDGLDIWADYVPLCHSCHKRYDFNAQWRAALSRAWTPERRAVLSSRTRHLIADGKMGWSLYRSRIG